MSITAEYFHHDGGSISNSFSFSQCGITQKIQLLVASSWGGYAAEGAAQNAYCVGTNVTPWTSGEGNKKWTLSDPNIRDQWFPNRASGTIKWND